MDQKYFTIGKVSKMMNITVKTLHFYDKIGLLKPEYTNPQTKYRYYHANQLIYIEIIKAARNMDISPLALVPHFMNKNSNELIKLIQNHKDTLYEKIKNLSREIDGIEAVSKTLEFALDVDKSGIIYKREISDRQVIVSPFDPQKPHDEVSFDFYKLNALGSTRKLTLTYEEGVIYNCKENVISPELIFSTIVKNEDFSDCKIIPGGEYICTVFTEENAQEQFEKIFDNLSQHNLKAQFLVQMELMTDIFADKPKYLELQIKI